MWLFGRKKGMELPINAIMLLLLAVAVIVIVIFLILVWKPSLEGAPGLLPFPKVS